MPAGIILTQKSEPADNMAISRTTPQLDMFENIWIAPDVQDHAIGGKMVRIGLRITDSQRMIMDDQEWRRHVRGLLANELAQTLLDQNLMETTSWTDPTTGTIQIQARCFMTPSSDVRILRTYK
jgi:hypothetical protein